MTDFTGSMGYCEFQIPFFIEGVRVETSQMLVGTEYHEEAERIDRETDCCCTIDKNKITRQKRGS